MQDQILISSRDTLLVAVPFVLCLVDSIFRIDKVFFKSRNSPWKPYGLPRHAWNPTAEPVFTDPDGAVVEWPNRRRNRGR